MVGLLGMNISLFQGLYLHRTTQHINTRDKRAIQTRDPRNQAAADLHLILHSHRDQHQAAYRTIDSTSFVGVTKSQSMYFPVIY
jgi:hypothetical protein